ncbi:hypothetical protein FI667_g10181, partial [Globisporangium splendens]
MANTLATTKNWAPQGDKAMDASAAIVSHAPLSIVAPKSMIQSIWEEGSGHNEDAKHHHTAATTLLGAATSSLAKFKAAQEVHLLKLIAVFVDGLHFVADKICLLALLSIQTENLPDAAGNDGATAKASSATTSSTFTTTPGIDTSSPPSGTTPNTPAPPSSTGKKRRRRTAAQIDRKFSCNFPGCPKAYGSEGSLTQHQRLKHRQQQPDVVGANSNTQLGSFFLPLHRTPARSVASGAPTHRPNANSSRTVNIRPASIEDVNSNILGHFVYCRRDVSAVLRHERTRLGRCVGGSSHGSAGVEPLGAAPWWQRGELAPPEFEIPIQLYARVLLKYVCTKSSMRSKLGLLTCLVCCGCNSSAAIVVESDEAIVGLERVHASSACIAEAEPCVVHAAWEKQQRGDQPPPRQVPLEVRDALGSGPFVLGDSLMPLSNTSSRNSYDWSSSLASDSPHDSDQAIDSDILSVLADCDSSEMGDATSPMEFTMATTGPLLSSSYRSHTNYDGESEDQDMLPPGMDCFGVSDHAPSVASPTGGLRINDLFRRAEMGSNAKHGVDLRSFEVHSEWARSNNSREDTMYLSTHLENVAISSPPPSLKLEHQHGGSPSVNAGGSPSSSSILPNLEQFPSVSIESFAVKEVDELAPPEPMDDCDAPTEKSDPFAVGLENHSPNWSSSSHHHTEQHDANATSASMSTSSSSTSSSSSSSSSAVVPKPETSLLWMKEFPNASVLTPLETQDQFVDDVFHEEALMPARGPHEWKSQKEYAPGVFQSDKQAHPSQGFTGMLLGDFLFDPAEYGLEDTRMGSPLLCQQEEL